jgi:hypothetical protein
MGLFLFAATLMGMFLVVRFGWIKSWFVLKTLPGLLSARMIYALLPLGVGFSLIAVESLLPLEQRWQEAWVTLFFVSCSLSVPFMFWPPSWIKPGWLRWLEQEYGYCLDILVEEGQKMDRWEWEARVETRAGMQAWIDEVFARRRAEIDQRWVETRTELLFAQAESRGSHVIEFGARIESYVPQHRRQEEEERVRVGLQKLERLHKRKRKA